MNTPEVTVDAKMFLDIKLNRQKSIISEAACPYNIGDVLVFKREGGTTEYDCQRTITHIQPLNTAVGSKLELLSFEPRRTPLEITDSRFDELFEKKTCSSLKLDEIIDGWFFCTKALGGTLVHESQEDAELCSSQCKCQPSPESIELMIQDAIAEAAEDLKCNMSKLEHFRMKHAGSKSILTMSTDG